MISCSLTTALEHQLTTIATNRFGGGILKSKMEDHSEFIHIYQQEQANLEARSVDTAAPVQK